MKAWILHGVDDIRYEETARPQPTDGEVLLRVQAAGICGSDIPRIYRTGAHVHPLIPGHEFSGIVEQAVAVHAMRRVQLHDNNTVVVCGLGTIGMFLLMFLIEAGIRNILAVGNKDFQRRLTCRLGLDGQAYCDSREQTTADWVREHTNGAGADIVFECVGRNETFAQAVWLAAPSGQVCLVWNPYSDMALDKSTYWKILRDQLVITGTWNSSFMHEPHDDWHYVLDRLSRKRILPEKMVTHMLPMEGLEHGMHIMRDKTEDYVKIMVSGIGTSGVGG